MSTPEQTNKKVASPQASDFVSPVASALGVLFLKERLLRESTDPRGNYVVFPDQHQTGMCMVAVRDGKGNVMEDEKGRLILREISLAQVRARRNPGQLRNRF